MRTTRILAMTALFVAPSLVGRVALAQQSQSQSSTGDPVADAARKAREEKKATPKPKKVFTDDDVKPADATPAPAPSSASSTGSTTPGVALGKQAKPGSDKSEDPNSETAWRKRFAEQRRKISDAEQELDVGLVRQVLQLVERSEYKRQQAAPVLKVTRKSFGMGRRFPIAVKVQV